MVALAASVPPWIPQDDLLLKNAVEAGASLEALAKGAVRFSRKFTVRELRDRWYSLLYDPIVSAEASARMVEFELSVPNSEVSAEVSVKRKLESVRRLYYSMRKKTCKRARISLLGAPDIDNFPFDSPSRGGNLIFGNHNQIHFGFGGKEMAFSHPIPENSPPYLTEELPSQLAIWETIERVSVPAMPMRVSAEEKDQEEALIHGDDVELGGNKVSLSEMNVIHSGAISQDKDAIDVLNSSTAVLECDYADLSESLFDFPNEHELLLMDANGEDRMDKSCYDGIFVSCADDVHGNELDVKDSQTLVTDKSLVIPGGTGPEEAIVEGSLCGDVKQHVHFCSETSVPSSTSTKNMELFDGEMECTLNSEDPEIPCNDDVFLPKQFTSKMRTTSKKTGYPFYSYTNLKDAKQEKSSVRKEENPAQSRIVSQIKGLETLPETSQDRQLVGCGEKCESPDDMAFSHASNAHRDPNQCRTAQTTLTSGAVGVPKTEALRACNDLDLPLYASTCFLKQATSASEADPMMDQEESESDNDIPSYSDIEAMILGMDLCPDDTYSYIDRQVSRYQNEDTRRTSIRLEQCARSSIQRSIVYRGALAVLYGRLLKHYIRETEVILGRATEDMEIDIDLGREGPANKISRRQAFIKMEADGSFFLKNLGKSLVFLNGKEVTTGQSVSLGSGGLIEIGEMAFLFEINIKSVRRHLANAAKNR